MFVTFLVIGLVAGVLAGLFGLGGESSSCPPW